jgi:hypothetical protein
MLMPPKLLLLSIMISLTLANPKCMVDMCATCPDTKTPRCTSCESGYYLKSFTAHEGKPYNDCWWRWYWWLGLLGIIGLLLASLAICYKLYELGEKKWLMNGGHRKVSKNADRYAQHTPPPSTARPIQQPPVQYIQQPQPQPVLVQPQTPVRYAVASPQKVIAHPQPQYTPSVVSNPTFGQVGTGSQLRYTPRRL